MALALGSDTYYEYTNSTARDSYEYVALTSRCRISRTIVRAVVASCMCLSRSMLCAVRTQRGAAVAHRHQSPHDFLTFFKTISKSDVIFFFKTNTFGRVYSYGAAKSTPRSFRLV